MRYRRSNIKQLIISISKDKPNGLNIRLPFLKILVPQINFPYMEV